MFKNISSSIGIRLVYLTTLVLLSQAANSAENLSPLAQAVQAATPDYVKNISITEDENRVRVTGEVASNQEVSSYMRLLADRVAMPNLESVQRRDSVSVFILSLRK